ncbi:proline racemase [Candidatus Bathyarchaeota archaeon]|nr:proline racemase [Candidatus Bathyarchaeota archaeon]
MKFNRYVSCIDTHCSGESTRILVGGVPKLKGKTMQEKQKYFQKHYDHLVGTMLQEPRGFSGMLGSVLTEPCHPDADIGVIYLWTGGYFSACGDSTYSCSAALVNTGMVEVTEPFTHITFDTVTGLVKTKVEVENGNAKRIYMEGVPSFYWKTMKFDIPDVGEVEADIAYGGLWDAFIDADSIGLKPTLENKDRWIPLGWKIRNYIADQIKVDHPEYPELNILDLVTFYTKPSKDEYTSRHWNVFGPKQTCRSPAGTCTNARMAAMYGKGEIKPGDEVKFESTISTVMVGKIAKEKKVGKYDAIVPDVMATAYVTGFMQVVIDPDDPLKDGFLL